MTENTADLLAKIQALPPEELERLKAQLGAGGGESGTATSPSDRAMRGVVNLSADARIDGVAVGIHLGRIVFGRDPEEDERRRLAWYLANLSGKLCRLPLRGISDQLERGDGISMPQVYVTLATQTPKEVATSEDESFDGFFDPERLKKARAQSTSESPPVNWMHLLRKEHRADFALPAEAITNAITTGSPPLEMTEVSVLLLRQSLAAEAVHDRRRVVLLGDPGSGKSTFLRHLAWALALRGQDQLDADAALFGWADGDRLLPVLLPLRRLGGRLLERGASEATVHVALADEMQRHCVQNVEDLLTQSLHSGAAIIMLDGLDEVPLDAVPGVTTNRETVLEAVRAFAQMHQHARFVLTCRTRGYGDELRKTLGWETETVAPFTLGQVRHFVHAWYGELVHLGELDQEQAAASERELVGTP